MVELDFSKLDGLITAVVQDWDSGEVLMVAFMNQEAWEQTLATGKAHYYSRTRSKQWMKGESSGHVQIVKETLIDCDNDCVVLKVEQIGGAACHTGYNSCFYRRIENGELQEIKYNKIFDPDEVYKK